MTTYRKQKPDKLPGHSLSRGTEAEYWRLLAAATRVWAEENGFEELDSRQREAARVFFHTRALRGGVNKSMTTWTSSDVDRVFAFLIAYAKGGHVAAAFVNLDQTEEVGHRKRMIYRITKYHGHGTVIAAYTHDRTRDPESVATADLENVARTCSERMRSAVREEPDGANTDGALGQRALPTTADVPFNGQF